MPIPIQAPAANGFNFLRLAAALAVILSHSFPLVGLAEPTPIAHQTFGSLAVATFFAMSGFLVCQSWTRDASLKRFAARRLLRIVPGLAVVTVFTALVLGPAFSTLPPADYYAAVETWTYLPVTGLALNIPPLPGLFVDNVFPVSNNGSLWTLRYELLMYAVLGGTGALLPRAWFRPACAVALCACAATGLGLSAFGLAAVKVPVLWRLGTELYLDRICNLGVYFFAGCCLYLFRDRVRLSPAASAVLVLACCLVPNALVANVLLWITVPYAALSIACAGPAFLRRFNRFDWSYGVYIYAFPVQQAFAGVFGRSDHAWLLCLVGSTAVTLVLAALSWHLVESPALKFKTRIGRDRQAGPRARTTPSA